jgi:hypothetical protein
LALLLLRKALTLGGTEGEYPAMPVVITLGSEPAV